MTTRRLASLRAAWWGFRAIESARRLPAVDLVIQPGSLPAVPPGVWDGERGLRAALRLRRPNCLVRATVLQSWHAAHGDFRDVVIGVTSPSSGFKAHAWLDGQEFDGGAGFSELTRRPAPR